MKFLLSTALIAISTLLIQLVMPWWSLMFAAMAVGVWIPLPGFLAFLSGLIGTAAVWWVYAWMIDSNTNSILSDKVAVLLKVGSPAVLILIAGVLAGLVGGFAAASGSALRKSMG